VVIFKKRGKFNSAERKVGHKGLAANFRPLPAAAQKGVRHKKETGAKG